MCMYTCVFVPKFIPLVTKIIITLGLKMTVRSPN